MPATITARTFFLRLFGSLDPAQSHKTLGVMVLRDRFAAAALCAIGLQQPHYVKFSGLLRLSAAPAASAAAGVIRSEALNQMTQPSAHLECGSLLVLTASNH